MPDNTDGIDAIFHLGGGFYKRMKIPELLPTYKILIAAPSSLATLHNLLVEFQTDGEGMMVGKDVPYLYMATHWSFRPDTVWKEAHDGLS